MKNKLAIAGVIALALTTGGCMETVKEWFKQNAPAVACKTEASKYAKWVADGRPVDRGGQDEAALIRAGIELAHKEVREWCASKGITIN